MERKDLIGQTFARWTVLRQDLTKKRIKIYWFCKCTCGTIKSVVAINLTSGITKSCGCLRNEISSEIGKRSKKHGLEGTRFYRIWTSMKQRCTNINNKDYPRYGGRSIIVCPEWLQFENFRNDMYKSYLKHVEEFGEKDTSIDRIKVMGNYEPSNCRWATCEEQWKNRRTSAKTKNYKEHKYWKARLRNGIGIALKRNTIQSFCVEYLGCSIQEFKTYIESLFTEGMTWENRGTNKKDQKRWQLDHIVGCNNFDLSKEEDRLKCFHYTNFQPLWWEDNVNKNTLRQEFNTK
jgi:hypothetical protein